MGDMYPYMEYMKVLAAYVVLLYIWPNVVFHRFLRAKSLTFRFLFCSTAQIVLINGVVLGLGLFGVLHVWVVRVLFWGAFGISLVLLIGHNNGSSLKSIWPVNQLLKRRAEYLALTAVLLFGMAYFSFGSLQDFTYGHYDQYIHFPWILDLKQGKIFSGGIYPEAMHCFIYCMRYLFGVKIYSSVLFLSGIHISTFLLAAYCLLKEVFHHRCIPLAVLTAWLTFDAGIEGMALTNLYVAMGRLSWTLPQEFGIHLVFLCPLFLLRFFRQEETKIHDGNWYQNENLFFLMLSVGAALSVHFYAIILAFIVCLTLLPVYIGKIFKPRRIWMLVYAVGNGVNIGAAPMILAYLMGKEQQVSLQWGISLLQGGNENMTDNAPVRENVIRSIYEKGYVAIFGEQGALSLVLVCLLIILFLYGSHLFLHSTGKQPEKKGYLFTIAASVILVFVYAAPSMGLPEFVAVDRILGIVKMFVFAVYGIVIDMGLFYAFSAKGKKIMKGTELLLCIVIYGIAYLTDFHMYLYSFIQRYKEAVLVTEEIAEEYEASSYAIVSMNREKGQMEDGQREEMADFLKNIDKEEYHLPVEYIFLYIEKRPVVQGQRHYYDGPSWLAARSSLLDEEQSGSQCPDILQTEISWEMSFWELPDYPDVEWYYWSEEDRTRSCSKAYYWYQDFTERYPQETDVYFENENFVCYVIHQDPKEPLNLAVTEQ